MAGIHQRAVATKKLNLAMKTSLHLTWRQLRKQKRFLRSIGVKVGGEQQDRAEQQRLIGDHLVGEMKDLSEVDKSSIHSVSGVKIVSSPVVKVESLRRYVTHLLNEYDRCNKLTWETNGIPEDEVWIKIGGDHGGGSFKLCLQVLNISCPNAVKNVHAILCFNAKDMHSNIDKVLSEYKNQIRQLQLMHWKEKKLRIFLFGDYEFLCKLYGLSGARGTYCCLWCLIRNDDIQHSDADRCDVRSRSLISLKLAHQKFNSIGKAKKINASSFYNCIHEPIWDIPIDHVAPPYLHILLGIVKKHHDLLIDACHKLDVMIAEEYSDNIKVVKDNPFGNFISHLRKMRHLMAQRQTLVMKYRSTDAIDKEISSHANKLINFAPHEGPVAQSIEETMYSHKIVIQAYHSRSMVGNHCHKYIQPLVCASICDSIVTKTNELTDDYSKRNTAGKISSQFMKLNQLYCSLHMDICHGNYIPPAEYDSIQKKLSDYLCFYRQCFPGKVIPKQHILEDHILPWINKWGVGLALHGEQGGESIHRRFNTLLSTHTGIRNELNKLMAIMRDHHTETSPAMS